MPQPGVNRSARMLAPMPIDRRRLLSASMTGAVLLTRPAAASAHGLDAAQFGVHPGAPDDQSAKLQRAIDHAARTRMPLWLAPGHYRAGGLRLRDGVQLIGVRGATRIVFTQGATLLSAEHAEAVSLSGLVMDGGKRPLPARAGLVQLAAVRDLGIRDCDVLNAGGNGIALERCEGVVTRTTIANASDNALFSLDSRGLQITANTMRGSGNGGIRVWQSEKRYDGSLVADNTIEDTHAVAGGSGQNGNAINIFRATNVIVRGNHVRNAAFSAVRGNAASDLQIVGNNCGGCDEVALYCEFAFENAVIADNIVDGAGSGVSVTNFKEGGRLATVRGNVLRHLQARANSPAREGLGIGISVEADTAVSGNVIEDAQAIGIAAGWGRYLRDVAITGNVLRRCGIGVAVSVVDGVGAALVANNLIAGAKRGAIVGMEWRQPVTGDLARTGAEKFPQLRIGENQVS